MLIFFDRFNIDFFSENTEDFFIDIIILFFHHVENNEIIDIIEIKI